jgi:hypothetical protein
VGCECTELIHAECSSIVNYISIVSTRLLDGEQAEVVRVMTMDARRERRR